MRSAKWVKSLSRITSMRHGKASNNSTRASMSGANLMSKTGRTRAELTQMLASGDHFSMESGNKSFLNLNL